MDHQNPSQEPQQQNQNQNLPRRRPTEVAVAAAGAQNLPHPPPQTCPRCNSNNTKFCYYNNYSLAQPRYFCKGCRRYWTQGGTLRNVPVGGGSRKRKRPKLASSSATVPNVATAVTRSLQEPPFEQSSQLDNNGGMSQNPSPSLLGTPISGASAYYGGGFLASLSGIPAVNFGSNLGLLHGLGLPPLDHGLPQQQQQQHHQHQQHPHHHHQQEPLMSFQRLLHQHHHHHQNLTPSLASTLPGAAPSSGDWILSNNNNDDDNTGNNDGNNNNNSNNDPNRWPDFQMGSTGLEDP